MPKFSDRSRRKLETCDRRFQELFNEVVKHFDCAIIYGHRDQEGQDRAFSNGKTQLRWPNSKHNNWPSAAVDVAPYPIDWNDKERFILFAGFVKGLAASMGLEIIWGGDWDGDNLTSDNRFNDLVHFELKGDL